jgi:hypothetical protein
MSLPGCGLLICDAATVAYTQTLNLFRMSVSARKIAMFMSIDVSLSDRCVAFALNPAAMRLSGKNMVTASKNAVRQHMKANDDSYDLLHGDWRASELVVEQR